MTISNKLFIREIMYIHHHNKLQVVFTVSSVVGTPCIFTNDTNLSSLTYYSCYFFYILFLYTYLLYVHIYKIDVLVYKLFFYTYYTCIHIILVSILYL